MNDLPIVPCFPPAIAYTAIPYTGSPLDRKTERREDAPWLKAAWRNPDSRLVLFRKGMPLLRETADGLAAGLLSSAGWPAPETAPETDAPILLGSVSDAGVERVYFALAVDEADPRLSGLPAEDFRDLRTSAALLPVDELAILTQAKGMVEWHARTGFCCHCGHATVPSAAGSRRDCPQCGAQHFPRIDPAVIVLVTRGDNCLLATNASWPTGRFSTLAGYVEPGEGPEEAVIREVREEVGVGVRHVRYFAAQPWPFPSAMMLGFFAESEDVTLTRDPGEIAAARWFTRAEARALLAGDLPGLSGPIKRAIARYLIASWAGGPVE